VVGEVQSGSGVELVLDRAQMLRSVDAQVGALGEELAQQPIGVLVRAALPGRVRVAEVDRDSAVGGDFGMTGLCVPRTASLP
jgi:hypothetical protein